MLKILILLKLHDNFSFLIIRNLNVLSECTKLKILIDLLLNRTPINSNAYLYFHVSNHLHSHFLQPTKITPFTANVIRKLFDKRTTLQQIDSICSCFLSKACYAPIVVCLYHCRMYLIKTQIQLFLQRLSCPCSHGRRNHQYYPGRGEQQNNNKIYY